MGHEEDHRDSGRARRSGSAAAAAPGIQDRAAVYHGYQPLARRSLPLCFVLGDGRISALRRPRPISPPALRLVLSFMRGDWSWATVFLLGAYHGINPGMGWLSAVALGMQEKRARAVVRSLAPITLGHALAIGVVIALAGLAGIVVPLNYLKIAVAAGLIALGAYRIVRSRHFHWGGMQVGFSELTLWSFLMASAHGAGFMVLPVVMGLPASSAAAAHHMHVHSAGLQDPITGLLATLVHTLRD